METTKAPHIAWADLTAIPYGTALSAAQLNATADVPGVFTYTPSVGTVLSAGSHTLSVTFTPADAANYSSVTASVTLKVNQAVPALRWAPPSAIPYGTALSAVPLNATADVPGVFTYAPSLNSVLPTGSHSLSVIFTPTDTTDYSTASASSALTVDRAAPVLSWTSPAAISYGTVLSAAQLNATANVPGVFTYTPSPGTVLSAGSHTLSATFTPSDATDYSTATASVTLKVNDSAPLLNWATPAAISYGAALSAAQLNATASVPGVFTYTPSPGTVLSAGSHTLSVTFTPSDAADYSTASASSALTVDRAAPVLSWTSPAAISYGTALSAAQLNATASVPGVFTYTPSLGTVLSAGSHTLSVTFTPSDATDYSTATASVTLKVNESVPALNWTNPAAISYGTALSAAQLNATANVPGVFTYTPSPGTVLSAGSHTLSVTFTPSDATDYSTATASVMLKVNNSAPLLNWTNPAAISYGMALSAAQLNATASVPGVFTYTPSLGTVLSAGSHTLSVTFTPSDATDYSTATASVTLKVNDSAPLLNWATPATISYGTALSAAQLNATANVPGVFTYTPFSGTVLSVGSHTLSVIFTPTDATDYSTATASVRLVVSQATPLISWVPAAPIAVGMALGPGQLNAMATVPGGTAKLAGNFVYTPSAGSILTASGAQTLSVTFTPTDTKDFTKAEASVTLTVAAFGVVAWGDSLTFGRDGLIDKGDYPSLLQALTDLPVQNMGVIAQTSTQIGVREGGVPVDVTVAGGTIPASGGVTVTFPKNYEPINSWGPAAGVSGSILGVHGTVKLASGVFTFTPTTSGSAVSAPGTPKFIVDTPYASYIPVFWEGENNFFAKAQILSDIAAQVATVSSERTYLVLSITNRDVSSDWIGGTGYSEIVAINNQLANTYGSHYLDVRQLLISNYDPTLATDVSDYNHDVVPTSLRAISGVGSLGSSIGESDTSFTVNLTTGSLSVNSILTIDTGENAENVKITAVSGSTVTVTRNYGGLNGAHAAGAPVAEADYVHLNAKGYQIIANAVAQYLSEYESSKQ